MEPHEYHKMYSLEESNWWYLGRADLIHELLDEYKPSFDSILDIGCGTGSILGKYSGKRRVGIEQNAIAVEYAKGRGLTVHDSLDKVHEKFDVILMMDVLEHVENDHAFLQNALTRLNEDGVLILTVPAFQWLWSHHDELVHHYRRYSKPMVKKVVEQSGGKCLHASYWNASFFAPAFLKKKVFSSDESDLSPVHPTLNKVLLSMLKLENRASMRIPAPLGTSVYAVVKKK